MRRNHRLRRFRTLIMHLLPARAAQALERESRQWMLRCKRCDTARSYWEIGGIRYAASSTGKVVWIRCPTCARTTLHTTYRRDPATPIPTAS